jgi:predicted MFS family arabinose efflux permease
MNVGFYYMANACGRLVGTVLSGALYQLGGLTWCLWASVLFVLVAGTLSRLLPNPGRTTGSGSSHAEAASEALTTPTSGPG